MWTHQVNNEDWGLCVWTDKRDQKVIGSNWVWYDPDVQGVGLCMDQKPSEGLGSVWTNQVNKDWGLCGPTIGIKSAVIGSMWTHMCRV